LLPNWDADAGVNSPIRHGRKSPLQNRALRIGDVCHAISRDADIGGKGSMASRNGLCSGANAAALLMPGNIANEAKVPIHQIG
jgi:hypothetical protein